MKTLRKFEKPSFCNLFACMQSFLTHSRHVWHVFRPFWSVLCMTQHIRREIRLFCIAQSDPSRIRSSGTSRTAQITPKSARGTLPCNVSHSAFCIRMHDAMRSDALRHPPSSCHTPVMHTEQRCSVLQYTCTVDAIHSHSSKLFVISKLPRP